MTTRVVIPTDDGATAEARPAGFEVLESIEPDALPDVVVIDEIGTDPAALARMREARAATPAAKLVLLTSSTDVEWLEEA